MANELIPIYSNEVALKKIIEIVPKLNEEQIRAITSINGPIQIIAGPGSGKTTVLILRCLYILLTGNASPEQILITTFTKKVARELRNRLNEYGDKLNCSLQTQNVHIGTIHSICDDIIQEEYCHTDFTKGYEVLDTLGQPLFIKDNLLQIDPKKTFERETHHGKKWKNNREIVKNLGIYFNKIAEELIDQNRLFYSNKPFLKSLAKAYMNYKTLLVETNKLDFAHLQKIFYELLRKNNTNVIKIRFLNDLKYLMVDEYQDTNYIQEQIYYEIASKHRNICVVGDEDQSLYRFRGATIRNIIEFGSLFPDCQRIDLVTNYRSLDNITTFCDKVLNLIDWSDDSGNSKFRFDKKIKSHPDLKSDSPSIITIKGSNSNDEAIQFVDLICLLKDNHLIEDFSQIALLLHSTRQKSSGHYIKELEKRNIPYLNMRSKEFFAKREISELVACFALIAGCEKLGVARINSRQEIKPVIDLEYLHLYRYLKDSIKLIADRISSNPDLLTYLQEQSQTIDKLVNQKTNNFDFTDWFYHLLGLAPFSDYLNDELKAKNLAAFSQILSFFQKHYGLDRTINFNINQISDRFFLGLLDFLFNNGIDNFEDIVDSIPKDHVRIMTIHQSKGLEFPVVFVGSLDQCPSVDTTLDTDLSPYYQKHFCEPTNKIADFDLLRQFYVAFSRTEKLLILSYNSSNINKIMKPLVSSLSSWQDIPQNSLRKETFKDTHITKNKRSFGFISDIHLYELCPRKYRFVKELGFYETTSKGATFGDLVHRTIEDIHNIELSGNLSEVTIDKIITEYFEPNYESLISKGRKTLSKKEKLSALDEVWNYFVQRFENDNSILNYEMDVSMEMLDYVINGRIDLLVKEGGLIKIIDFKSRKLPQNDPKFQVYYNQLCIYAAILKNVYGSKQIKYYIYWTHESEHDNALMEVSIKESEIKDSIELFNRMAKLILQKNYTITKIPNLETCLECDFRHYCNSIGTISLVKKT